MCILTNLTEPLEGLKGTRLKKSGLTLLFFFVIFFIKFQLRANPALNLEFWLKFMKLFVVVSTVMSGILFACFPTVDYVNTTVAFFYDVIIGIK